MSGILNSSINGSASNLPDSSGRTFTTSFSAQSGAASPAFHHGGSIQGLHNMHGSFNIPNMPGTLASRNSSMGNVPSGGVQQPTGSLATGRFASNNLPVALSQISHGSSHGHSGVTNRGGLGVSPILGNAGPRITNSMGSMVGGNIGRSIGSGGGISVPGLGSRINLTGNSGSGSLGVQAQNRLMSNVLQQANPQVISMLGNSYPSAGGPLSQSHVQAMNSLNSMGVLNDVNSNDNSPFDINDFPQLTSRPNSSGGPQGQIGSMRKQGLGVSPIVQQNQEFSIQNEDFPALPGFKGGSNDYGVDLHQKEQLHDNMSMMQSQHFSMGRSAGFSLGGAYSSNRPQQQQQRAPSVSGGSGVSFTPANNQDLSHMHGSDMFPSSPSMYHLQSGGAPGIGLRTMNAGGTVSGMSSYDQVMQQYQQQQNQSQFRLHQMSAVNQSFRDQGMKSMQATQAAPDPFGLLGLLSVIRMSDPDLTSLALGMDLTTLGLNLNSSENLYKTFASPWSEEHMHIKSEPEFAVPQCFNSVPRPPLKKRFFQKFRTDTLFYVFYSMPKDEAQLYAADELIRRGWMYHRELRMWLTLGNMDVLATHPTYERGSFICFDPNTWETVIKENFILQYEAVEKKPNLVEKKPILLQQL